jgi:aryl-alcohol dehydrogenase-like predicted oxidoreductase
MGTANWGTSYGAPGRAAHVDRTTAAELAQVFTAAGHDLVDTAPAYGEAETIVGDVFQGAARVVTKIGLHADDAGAAVALAVESVHRSLRLVRADRLAGVLLHDSAAAVTAPALAREVLEAVRAEGIADRVGVSVYAPAEAMAAVEVLGADLLQVPCNVLDQRFAGSFLPRLAALGVEVHVRSALLNGVLVNEPAALTPALAGLRPAVERFHAFSDRLGATPLQAAVAFVRQLDGAAAVVLGAFAPAQLHELMADWQTPPFDVDAGGWAQLSVEDESVDPRTWAR